MCSFADQALLLTQMGNTFEYEVADCLCIERVNVVSAKNRATGKGRLRKELMNVNTGVSNFKFVDVSVCAWIHFHFHFHEY